MSRINPYTLQMQITQMFAQGQSFFALTKVQDWLKEHNQNPLDYEIIFHKKPAPPGSKEVIVIEIELKRKDGEPVDSWLQEQANLPRVINPVAIPREYYREILSENQ